MKKLSIIIILASSCYKPLGVIPKRHFDKVEIFTTLDASIQTDGDIVRNEVRTKIILNASYVSVSNSGEGYYIATRGTKRDSGYIHNNLIIK